LSCSACRAQQLDVAFLKKNVATAQPSAAVHS
jgi:hypothetical protein